VRPLGLSALGLPCQLMGTGMAFPWAVIRSAGLAGGHIVEDLELGLDLARAGHLPLFCPSALVTSRFPSTVEAARGQRERWEHGHVATSLSALPRLLAAAWRRRSFVLLALALDAVVPPLTLLALLAIGTLALAAVAALLGGSAWALWVSTANVGGFLLAVLLAWIGFGREVLPAAALVSVGAFVRAKLPIYGRLLLRGPVAQWTRTDRK
jgi:cellulose synthase/poly-beta-1,6-N-acetylglucosamine synthase-like glycosyltransferase